MTRLYDRPYLLLMLATLFWAGNFVLARSVRLDVPPIGLAFWRWSLAGALLLPFVWEPMRAAWPLVRGHLRLVVTLALLGVTLFNTFVYLGLQTTTASNGVLLQSVMPVMILLLSRLVLDTRVSAMQALGILVSMGGVLVIVTRGDAGVLLQFDLTRGDLWIIAAVLAWALYSVLLHMLPRELRGPVLLGYTVLFGLLGIAPAYAWEISRGLAMPVNLVSVGSVSYVALFPSLLSFLFWNRAVLLVGPNRAGQFIHLIPVFGTLLSVLLLGERLFAYHLVGIVTVASGILMATRYKRPPES